MTEYKVPTEEQKNAVIDGLVMRFEELLSYGFFFAAAAVLAEVMACTRNDEREPEKLFSNPVLIQYWGIFNLISQRCVQISGIGYTATELLERMKNEGPGPFTVWLGDEFAAIQASQKAIEA